MTTPIYDTADLMRGWKALDGARDAYVLAWTYYAGTLPERFASERIRQLVENSSDESYRFRFASKPVVTLKNRVRLAGVTGSTDEITTKLEAIRRANSMDMLEPFLHERTFAYGDGYLLTYPLPDLEDGQEDPFPEDMREAGVEITWQSPLSCRAMYDAEDGLRLQYVIRRWKETLPTGVIRWHAELWYPDGRIETWRTRDGSSGGAAEEWEPETEPGEAWPLVHDFGSVIHHARNGLPYGRPEHINAYGPQDALTKLNLTQAVVGVEAHTWPERFELLDPAVENDTARDAVDWGDDTQAPAVSPTRATTSRRRSGPGMTHVLSGRKNTGQYDSPNPADMVPLHDQWLRSMATITDTPAYEYDPERGNALTGIGRMWADKPLANREDNAKRFLERFWREVYGKALEIAGVPEPGEITLVWGRADVIMDPDWWQVASVRRDHGVPQEQILREANYDPDDIEQWLDDNDEARTLLEKITLVSKLGEALQALGSAVALGVIEQGKVDALVTRILGVGVIEQSPPEPEPSRTPVIVPDPREIEQ